MNNKLKFLAKLVEEQAEDEWLWCIADTASEEYLQKELRKLHVVVEDCLESLDKRKKISSTVRCKVD
jgi:hypothetical protein